MEWGTALFMVFSVGVPLGGLAYYLLVAAWGVIDNAWETHFDEAYELGKNDGRTFAFGVAYKLGFLKWQGVNGSNEWLTRDEIADEVIAERQKQRQEHVRTQMACACDRVDRWSEQND
jgi:hypothetical protein